MSSSDDAAWPLPKTWAWTTAGQIAQVIGGGTPDTKDSENFGGFIPWITPADMSTHVGKTIAGGSRFLTEKGLSGSGARWLPEGTVLFSSRAPIGYTAVASRQVTTNQGFKSFVPESCITSDYLYHWLASSKERAEKLASGTTFLELSGAKASLMPVPLAPVAEQVRVVEKLEELLSDLDAGVAELKVAQRKLAKYRQSLLKAAVDGTLTAHWRAAHGAPQETGAELLQRILTERRARWEQKQLAKYAEQGKTPPKGWQAKYSEPAYPDLTGYLSLPEGWTWTSLDQLIAESSYGTSVKCGYDRGGEPVLRIPNVGSGKIDLQDMKFATERLSLEAEDYLAVGDVLVIRTNGSIGLVGRAAVVSDVLPSPHYFASYLLRLRCVETACSHRWINFVLASPVGRHWIESKAASSAGQHNISLSTLLTMPVPLPPIAEQEGALIAVETALEAASEQLRTIEKSLGQTAAQRKNLLRAAFSGQLVPQDPNDEPASELLARIRAARERSPAPRGRRRSASHPAPATNPPTPTPRGRKAKAGA